MASPPPRQSPPRPPQQSLGFKPRSFEDQVRYAYFSPTPQHYNPKRPGARSETILGKISEAKNPSALDHGQREAALVPGPGSYDTPDLRDISLPEGGRLNRKPPQERFKLDEYPSPAPGAYGVPHDPTVPRHLYGSFGKDPRVSKFIQDEVNRSRGVPAPGSNDVMESMESLRPFCPEGGRYLEQKGRDQSYFDGVARQATGGPDPTRYNLPGAINPHKAAGKLVWKYQSESLAKTKKVIERVVGSGHEVPAPGTYTLPDPDPIAPVPTLKGRTLSHGMPHPFAYNCSPDLSGKFDDQYRSVVDKNSGDQIYGRDFKRGSPPMTKDRPARAAASADEVVAANMPVTLAERDIEQEGRETVQWRSGGFAALRKAKSVPVIEREHPAVESTKQRYAPMSLKAGRKQTQFAPWAHRKPEKVKTSSKSEDYVSLQRKKWELEQINHEILAGAADVVEPLDLAKLRTEATKGLIDKAKFRMRMEGLGKEQQNLVLSEFPGVLMESAGGGGAAEEEEAFVGEPFPADVGDSGDF